MKPLLYIFSILLFSLSCQAQKGYEIKVKIKGLSTQKVQLGYYYEDKKYIVTEQVTDPKGNVTFSNNKPLLHGIYMLIIPEIPAYFDILIAKNQTFSITTKKEDITKYLKFTNSEENKNFYEYQRKVAKISAKLAKIDSVTFYKDSVLAKQKIKAFEAEITTLGKLQIKNNPNSFFTNLLQAMEATSDKNQTHMWQDVNLKENGLIRTPFFKDLVYTHLVRLNHESAETIIRANKKLLDKTEKDGEMRNYIAFILLNFYRTNQQFGMNKVFVEIADNYFLNGNSSTFSPKMLGIIERQRDIFKASFIGQVARNIKVANMKNDSIALHDIKANFTLLYFWSSGCGHCKKTSIEMKKYYPDLVKNNIKIVGLNTNETRLDMLEKYLKEKPVPWENYHDFKNNSRFKEYFYAVNAPQLFVLDKNKVIIRKINGLENITSFVKQIAEIK